MSIQNAEEGRNSDIGHRDLIKNPLEILSLNLTNSSTLVTLVTLAFSLRYLKISRILSRTCWPINEKCEARDTVATVATVLCLSATR